MTTERQIEPQPAVYHVPEVALLLRCDRRTIVRMLERGELRGVRVGRDWRVTRKSVEAFLSGEPAAPVILTAPKAAPTTKAKPKARKAPAGRRAKR